MGKGKIVKVSGIREQGRTATVLLRGSNKLVLEEAERSLHDALCVIRCLVHKRYLIPGGAAPEVELNVQLSRWAKSLVVPLSHVTPRPKPLFRSTYAAGIFRAALQIERSKQAQHIGLRLVAHNTSLKQLSTLVSSRGRTIEKVQDP